MRREQGLAVGNGALVLCFGLIAGYGFRFNLIGEIAGVLVAPVALLVLARAAFAARAGDGPN